MALMMMDSGGYYNLIGVHHHRPDVVGTLFQKLGFAQGYEDGSGEVQTRILPLVRRVSYC